MKRKIVIGLTVYSAVFLVAGIYIAFTIHFATRNLNRLVELHRVEILREYYLIQIKKVQSDLVLADTHFSRPPATVVANIANLGQLLDTCFQCHHSPQGTERLKTLKEQTDRYIGALTLITRARLHSGGPDPGEVSALQIGEELISKVRDMVDVANVRLENKRQEAMKEIADTKYVLFGLVVVGPLLSAMLGYIFIGGLTRPINVLLESSRRLKGGDLDYRIAGLRDEFGELATSFNEMAGSLKEQVQKMQRTEQMVLCGELSAGLVHEIKNPLAGIRAAMHVLDKKANLSEEEHGITRKVTEEVGRLEILMKSFLNFAKPAKPQFAELNVNQLINMTLAFYVKGQSIRPDPRHEIHITKDLQSLPDTMADPAKLQQVLLNIVLNAVESMPNGGRLNVRTSFDEGLGIILIDISDTGRGINQEHADKIFQPFFTTKSKGTGLGLAVSKQLVEQHGGSITAFSNSPCGSVFRIHLPWKALEGVTA